MDKRAPVIIARAWTDSEASVIKSLLESYHIPCHYSSELPHRIYPVSAEGLGEIRIYVPEPLAQEAISIVGMDFSPAMLSAARQKSQGLSNVRWVEGDMQAFELGEHSDLILIPGHSFQFMLTPTDQIACLTCIRQHLTSGGKLVVHVNHDEN